MSRWVGRSGWVTAAAVLILAVWAAPASADRGAKCTLTVVQARDGGDAVASFDPALQPLASLLSVPPFTIYKVFKRLFVTELEFTQIPQEREVTFSEPALAGLAARMTYAGFSASNNELLFEFKLSKGGQTLINPTLRLSGAPTASVVPWPDSMNVLIFVFQCSALPEAAPAPAAAGR